MVLKGFFQYVTKTMNIVWRLKPKNIPQTYVLSLFNKILKLSGSQVVETVIETELNGLTEIKNRKRARSKSR